MSQRLSVEVLSANSIDFIARFLNQDAADLPPDARFVCARRDERIVLVAVLGRPAGRVIDILLPDQSERLDQEEAFAVLQTMNGLIDQHSDLHLAQVLLGTQCALWPPLLAAFDFSPITTVEILAALPETAGVDSPLTFSTMSQNSAFGHLLRDTWQDSLDCPNLKDERTSEDVLDEYTVRCRGDRTHWYQIEFERLPIGCAILSAPLDISVNHPLETLYWGILPKFRGRGLGDETLKFIRGLAARHGRMLAAAVDQKNLPARSVYLRNGFQIVDSQRLFIKYL